MQWEGKEAVVGSCSLTISRYSEEVSGLARVCDGNWLVKRKLRRLSFFCLI